MTPISASPLAPPRQQRSRDTLARIVAAAEGLLAERGSAGLTVNELLERADVSVGSFYARFSGKEALLSYLDQRFWDDARAWWDWFLDPARWEDVPVRGIVHNLVAHLVELHRKHPERFRAFMVHALVNAEEGLIERTGQLDAEVSKKLERLLLARRGELGHPDPRLAAGLAFAFLLSVMRESVLLGRDSLSRERLSDRSLIDEVTRLLLAYLGVGQ